MHNVSLEFETTSILCPIDSIVGVWEFKRPPNFNYLCYSLPGHLLHLVSKGSYSLIINGILYNVKQGDIIYYYESEEVETIGGNTDAEFYSISYQASKLTPLSIDKRVFSANKALQKLFKRIHASFCTNENGNNNFIIHSYLLKILSHIWSLNNSLHISKHGLWWDVEHRLRRENCFKPSLDQITQLSGYSRSTLNRLCNQATGLPPLKRMRHIRLEEAKGLLGFTNLTVTQVAQRLGYGRIQEFSREFSKHLGASPSSFRY